MKHHDLSRSICKTLLQQYMILDITIALNELRKHVLIISDLPLKTNQVISFHPNHKAVLERS